jgi:CBS domain-containing protein
MTVAGIIERKGSQVVAVDRDATLSEVTAELAAHAIGLVVVLSADGRLEGVVSERDVLRKLAAHGPAAMSLGVEQAMTRRVVTATPQTTLDEAMAMMTLGSFRHLPVLEDGELVGIISVRDVVRAQVDINQFEVRMMRAYLDTGSAPARLHA